MATDESFKYALACGSFNSESYIKVIDWIAKVASQTLRTTGLMIVVVQDNGSLYIISHLTCQYWQHWRFQELFLFFLPHITPKLTGLRMNMI